MKCILPHYIYIVEMKQRKLKNSTFYLRRTLINMQKFDEKIILVAS